ncbi:zinc ribbon domain-containing protein [Halorubrum sp. 48-1-W]|uniref:DUF7575 domain-containing protein n=1 Tax=Halorubrum sp. 48-1-W TaxID=2249761 RepID=UPI000DCC9426|nr:DUF6677 family protein [Halorubrum sp. 48-1-W]RAW45888.1 zinc ribbon domain-containing protein [Halorubrum sp. 48-1-W]
MSEIRRRRPWLAVLLALLISGLGHAYLRRWARAFGWYVAITATLVFLVPDAAVDKLLAREAPPIADIAPGLLAVLASVVDAYVLAVRNNRRYDRKQRTADRRMDRAGTRSAGTDAVETGDPGVDPTGGADAEPAVRDDERPAMRTGSDDTGGKPPGMAPDTVECPHCGKRTDAELDFCHWCTEPLDATNGSLG